MQNGPGDFSLRLLRFTNRRFLVLFLGLITLIGLAPVESLARVPQSFHWPWIQSGRNRTVAPIRPVSHRSRAKTLPRLIVTSKKRYQPPPNKAAAANTLILAVQQFVAAGETDDVAQRATYLAPQVFFYGHNRTREQASKEMTHLNRWWPQRRYAAPESFDVYAIPNRPDAYKVVSVYEYEMINREQDRLTGKARLTCIFEYGREGPRIVGVNEKLLTETTRLYRDYDSVPAAWNQKIWW